MEADRNGRGEKEAQKKKGWLRRLLDWITEGNRRAAQTSGQCPT
jgi:hypothetical protein